MNSNVYNPVIKTIMHLTGERQWPVTDEVIVVHKILYKVRQTFDCDKFRNNGEVLCHPKRPVDSIS